MNKYRIKKVIEDNNTIYYYPQVKGFFRWCPTAYVKKYFNFDYYEGCYYEGDIRFSSYEKAFIHIKQLEESYNLPKVEYLDVDLTEKPTTFSNLLLPKKPNE
jgi:hypothetical protein